MNVDLLNEVSFGSNSPGPDPNHTGMERAVDGRIVIKHRLQSVKDDNGLTIVTPSAMRSIRWTQTHPHSKRWFHALSKAQRLPV